MQNQALLIKYDRCLQWLVLYDIDQLNEYLTRKLNQDKKVKYNQYITKVPIGYIDLIKSPYKPNTYKVGTVAARDGKGPFMYDLAMIHVHPFYLMSDRAYTNKKARNIWNFYYEHRKNEFELIPSPEIFRDRKWSWS